MLLADPVDTLSGLVPLLRVRPELQQVWRFGALWTSEHAAESDRCAPFHFVTRGGCLVEVSGIGHAIPLSAGDGAVLPHGNRHAVRGLTTPAGAGAFYRRFGMRPGEARAGVFRARRC